MHKAIDYLLTYGWVFLVLIFVSSILYNLGVFNLSSIVGPGITGFAVLNKFASVEPVAWMVNSNGDVRITFLNNFGEQINITGVKVYYAGSFNTDAQELTALVAKNDEVQFNSRLTGANTKGSAYEMLVQVNFTDTHEFPHMDSGVLKGYVV